jgi:hypothetical protein
MSRGRCLVAVRCRAAAQASDGDHGQDGLDGQGDQGAGGEAGRIGDGQPTSDRADPLGRSRGQHGDAPRCREAIHETLVTAGLVACWSAAEPRPAAGRGRDERPARGERDEKRQAGQDRQHRASDGHRGKRGERSPRMALRDR